MENKNDKENIKDLLEKIFVYNPKKRLTAKKILKHPFYAGME